MPLLPPVNSAAVQVLQQSRVAPIAVDRNAPPENELISAVNGVKTEEVKPTEDFWDITTVTPTQMKIKLFEAVGEAFGLSEEDFDSFDTFASAIEAAIDRIKEEDPTGAAVTLRQIASDLGLNELGISLGEVVEAMLDPSGSADDKLDAILKEKADEINGVLEDGEDQVFGSLRVDSNGIYSLLR